MLCMLFSLSQTQQIVAQTEVAVQTLQATSYTGVYVWEIPEIQRCSHEAKSSEAMSLHSEPFYTSRHGYRVCLRLYMNGDGASKGTHLSLFLVIMKGNNDNFLLWPFDKKVTVMLLNQNSGPDMIQSLQPDSNFQRPRNADMNIASSCPKFAPLSVLNNPSYV